MTAIAIWCNHEIVESPNLWIAADSRVIAARGSILIEDAAKLFGLPVVCRLPDSHGFFSNVYYVPRLDGGVFKMTCVAHENLKAREFVYLGTEKAQMHSAISAALAQEFAAGSPLCRAPRHVIENHINDDAFPGIGGDLQLGLA